MLGLANNEDGGPETKKKKTENPKEQEPNKSTSKKNAQTKEDQKVRFFFSCQYLLKYVGGNIEIGRIISKGRAQNYFLKVPYVFK